MSVPTATIEPASLIVPPPLRRRHADPGGEAAAKVGAVTKAAGKRNLRDGTMLGSGVRQQLCRAAYAFPPNVGHESLVALCKNPLQQTDGNSQDLRDGL
jgi:hypothetical protein